MFCTNNDENNPPCWGGFPNRLLPNKAGCTFYVDFLDLPWAGLGYEITAAGFDAKKELLPNSPTDWTWTGFSYSYYYSYSSDSNTLILALNVPYLSSK